MRGGLGPNVQVAGLDVGRYARIEYIKLDGAGGLKLKPKFMVNNVNIQPCSMAWYGIWYGMECFGLIWFGLSKLVLSLTQLQCQLVSIYIFFQHNICLHWEMFCLE